MDEDVLASLQEKADTQEALLQALKVRVRKAKEGEEHRNEDDYNIL